MKHNLGKILLFLGFSMLLYSEDFSYQFKTSTTTPYLKEAILLNFEVNQTNHDVVLMFNFNLKKSNDYYFMRVGEKEKEKYHNISIIYTYLLYPLKEGKLNIEFALLKKVTTDDKVAYSFSGDRDNVKGLVTTDTNIHLPPLTLKVKPLPKDTQIVGDFSLNYSIEKHQAEAYEPIGVTINVKGLGYPPIVKKLFKKEKNFKLFSETPTNKSLLTTKGIQNNLTYSIALSATQNFTMPSIKIKAFNPTLKKSYWLSVPSQKMTINPIEKKALLDKIDTPKPLKVDWSWVETFFQYLIVFLAGYFTRFSLGWQKKRNSIKKAHPLVEKIEKTKDKKSLLQLLLSSQIKAFNSTITQLEDAIYHQKNINLKEIKKELMERLK